MAKKSYGFESDDKDDPNAVPPGATDETVTGKTVAGKEGESVEATHTGDETPTAQAATPGVSATNPDLMANDAQPGVTDPIYAGSPRPPGWTPPPPGTTPPPEARGQERMRRT